MPEERRYEDGYNDVLTEQDKERAPGEEPEAEVVHLPILKPSGPPPQTRGDCLEGGSNAARPCRWITCKWYLPRMTLNPKFTCTLDVADQGGMTLEEVGALLGVTRERVRQIEEKVFRRIKMKDATYQRSILKKLVEDAPTPEGWDYHI